MGERYPRGGALGLVDARLLGFIRRNPGVSLTDLGRELGLTRNGAGYHVRKLVRRGLVRTLRQGRRVLHFPHEVEEPHVQSQLGVLRLRTVATIVEELRADPSLSWRKLARKLGFSTHTLRWHMARLEREGIVEVVRDPVTDRHVVLIPKDILALLEERLKRDRSP
jgi:predicted transcriptional regulator